MIEILEPLGLILGPVLAVHVQQAMANKKNQTVSQLVTCAVRVG